MGRRLMIGGTVIALLMSVALWSGPAIVGGGRHDEQTSSSTAPSQPTSAAVPAVAPPPEPPQVDGAASVSLADSSTAPPSTVGVPTQVDIPAIGVHSTIVPLGIGPDGAAQVPDRFDVAGWYSGGPRPGDPGPAVLLGHVDSYSGPAVFFHLRNLHDGDVVTVTSTTGPVRFRVDSVTSFPKTAFPTAQVYGPVPDRALRLVTCGGAFDTSRHSYDDNVIVFATEE